MFNVSIFHGFQFNPTEMVVKNGKKQKLVSIFVVESNGKFSAAYVFKIAM